MWRANTATAAKPLDSACPRWTALAKRQVRVTGSARRLALPHIDGSGGGGSSGIGGGCGSPNAASAADMAP